MEKYDLLVIGSGPAGEKAAAAAAYFKKRVAIVERAANVGGAGVNTGTIPSKTLRESALYFSGLQQRGLYGIDYSLRAGLTVHDFMHRENVVVQAEREKITKNIAGHSIDLLRGAAHFEDAHTLAITAAGGNVMRVQGEIILIATGSFPFRTPEISFDDKFIFDSDTILNMDRIPKSMVVVGGGVIGCEYASMFTALGVKVALVDGRDRLLPFLDAEISQILRDRLTALGLEFYFSEKLAKLERGPAGIRVLLESGKSIELETALFAAGRRAAVDGLDLEKVGLSVNKRGYLEVNEHYQTSVPNIYAAGDVIGFPSLASVSMDQGRLAVLNAFGLPHKWRLPTQLPMGVYTIPEISSVGETEESCKEKKIDYAVGRARYANNARGMIIGETHGLLKLVFQRGDHKLLGVHIIGESATDLVHIGMMVLEASEPIETFIDTVFNFPTLSEMYKYAAYDGLGNVVGHKLREG